MATVRAIDPTMPLRAITYGRVSTGRQATLGLSLDDQADTLAAEVEKRGWVHVDHVTDPGLSGRKMVNRPGLLGAVSRLDRGHADVLVAAKVDRLARSTADFADLLDRAEKHGWKVVVLDVGDGIDTTTASGRMVIDMISAAAQFESRRIGERVRAVHAVQKAKGIRAGQPPMLPDDLRRRIVDCRKQGASYGAIAKQLNEVGIPAARGGRWHASTIQHVVRSVALDEELEEIREACTPGGTTRTC
jgi:DNA invertase Pin-like site-specific DNA recombinase